MICRPLPSCWLTPSLIASIFVGLYCRETLSPKIFFHFWCALPPSFTKILFVLNGIGLPIASTKPLDLFSTSSSTSTEGAAAGSRLSNSIADSGLRRWLAEKSNSPSGDRVSVKPLLISSNTVVFNLLYTADSLSLTSTWYCFSSFCVLSITPFIYSRV